MRLGITVIATGLVLFVTVLVLDATRSKTAPVPAGFGIDVNVNTDPWVIGPGDEVKLTVRFGEEKCIFGKWRADRLEVKPEGWTASFKASEETWESFNFGYHASSGRSADKVNAPFRPWIRFRVPKNPDLHGKMLKLHVMMEGIYPLTHDAKSFEDVSYKFDTDVEFKVGAKEELAALRRYHQAGRDLREATELYGTLKSLGIGVMVVAVGVGFFLIIRGKSG